MELSYVHRHHYAEERPPYTAVGVIDPYLVY